MLFGGMLGALFNQLTGYVSTWRRTVLHKQGTRVKVFHFVNTRCLILTDLDHAYTCWVAPVHASNMHLFDMFNVILCYRCADSGGLHCIDYYISPVVCVAPSE